MTAASGGAVTSVPSTALGYASLDNTYTQRTLSLYGSYKYKNWGIRGEYGRKHGFLFADRPSNGFFAHISYDLTPKIQLVARFDNMAYDQFVALPSAQMVASILAGSSAFGFQKNTMREFTLGANYFIKGETLKVQTNYVHIYNKLFRDSDRFSVQTQYFVF